MTEKPTQRTRDIDSARNATKIVLDYVEAARKSVESAIYEDHTQSLKRLREAGRNLDLAIAKYEALEPPPEPMTNEDLRKLADACRRARPEAK